MEETLSWRTKLAKSNINITSVVFNPTHTICDVCFEFPYHPTPGQVKWLKTVSEFIGEMDDDNRPVLLTLPQIAEAIRKQVLELRKELEG